MGNRYATVVVWNENRKRFAPLGQRRGVQVRPFGGEAPPVLPGAQSPRTATLVVAEDGLRGMTVVKLEDARG